MDGYQEWAKEFSLEWLNELLYSIEKNCSEETCAILLDRCGACHYQSMEPMLSGYVGDLDGFIQFMSKEHGQVVTFDQEQNTILVDENKPYCVCPITQSMNGKKVSPVLCNCSASMTARMIAKVTGKEVKSRVVSSILRGDTSCVYEIKLL